MGFNSAFKGLKTGISARRVKAEGCKSRAMCVRACVRAYMRERESVHACANKKENQKVKVTVSVNQRHQTRDVYTCIGGCSVLVTVHSVKRTGEISGPCDE